MAADTELQRHQQDWEGFIRFTAYTAGFIVVTLVLLAIFVAH